ncbi:hypothetical protein ABWH96_07655 [Marivirga tractuosa]|uniref:hypothetical protein n=1 Tax=Marivirga tractuosa TaxID=1006 RepID=UPI0035CF688C
MMNLYLKRFFLGCIFLFSFNTVLLPQSLSNKNVSSNPVFSENETDILGKNEKKGSFLPDSVQESSLDIIEFKENLSNQNYQLKSKSGVFSVFNEIIYYWFHQF